MELENPKIEKKIKIIWRIIFFVVICVYSFVKWSFSPEGSRVVRSEYYCQRGLRLYTDDAQQEKALRYADKAIAADSTYWLARALKASIYFYNKRNVDSACVYYKQAIDLMEKDSVSDKSKSDFRVLYVKCLRQTKDYNEAIRVAEKSLELFPDKADFKMELCRIYTALKDYQNAEFYGNAYFDTHQNDAEAYFYLAAIYDETGRTEQAIAAYEKVLELNENNTNTMWNLSRLIWNTDRKRALNLRRKAAKLGHMKARNWFKKKGYEWD